MERKNKRIAGRHISAVFFLLLMLLMPIRAGAQQSEKVDSLVRLLSARSVSSYDDSDGVTRRKVIGPARFLHRDTYLDCDTALWNMNTNIIDAWGNVSIQQEGTCLTSDKLIYQVDSSLAMFRGSVVQLTDKDGNTLRTRHLDYYTADSLAIFTEGVSMKDKDGQLIESFEGRYESILKKFTFSRDVNMFSDTTFISTRHLEYFSDRDLATFEGDLHAWHNKYMLSSERGYYDRSRENFFFRDNVHLQGPAKEGWGDSLYVYRPTSDLQLLGHAQLDDSDNSTYALAGRIDYTDSLSKAVLRRNPAIAAITDSEQTDDFGNPVSSVDTVFIGADFLVHYSTLVCDMQDTLFLDHAAERKAEMAVDPVGEYRAKAAKAAAQEQAKRDAEDPNKAYLKKKTPPAGPLTTPPDTLTTPVDSLRAAADSLQVPVPDPIDSTKISFIEAVGRVKVFRSDMQAVCDSLLYNDCDSLVRLYKNPILWHNVSQQFIADSMALVTSSSAFERLNLMGSAFVHLQDDTDTSFFNQIRSAEMIAYFDTTSALSRYDALGDATALFFLEENDVIATANRKECRMLSATFENNEISTVYYYDSPKSNAYPVASMERDDLRIKGFDWQPTLRPATRFAVTPLKIRPSQRSHYSSVPEPRFRYTAGLFPGYMEGIHRQIALRDSLCAVAPKIKPEISSDENVVKSDSLDISSAPIDTLSNSLSSPKDTLLAPAAASDSLSQGNVPPSDILEQELSPEELKAAEKAAAKAAKQAEREKRKAERQARREERWRIADEKAAAKEAAKAEKAHRRLLKNKLKALKEEYERLEKEDALLNRYIDELMSKDKTVK